MLRTVCNLLKFAVILTLLEFSQNALLMVPQTGVAPDSSTGHLGGSDRSDVVGREENWRERELPSSGWELPLRDTGEVLQKGRFEEAAETIPPPSSVKLEFINISAVQVSWSYPFEDVPTPIQFILQCSKDGEPYQNASELLNGTETVYGHMLLSAYYQFRVVAYHGGLASEPSQPSYSFVNGITDYVPGPGSPCFSILQAVIAQQEPESKANICIQSELTAVTRLLNAQLGKNAPTGPPVNVKASAVSYSEIDLVWDPPFPAPPAPLIYLMFWGTSPEDLSQEDNVIGETHRSFQSLSPGQIYFFQLRTDISGHLSIPSSTVNVTTKGAVLPGVTITGWNVSAYWVWLSWSAPPSNCYPLTTSNFTVYYQQQLERQSLGIRAQFCCNLTVASDMLEANVTGLQPDTAYVFAVGYASRGFQSGLSKQKILTTTSSLQCYSCKALSSTELDIKWKTSSRGIHTVVIFEAVGTQRQRIAGINATESVGGYTVSGLHPWTEYMFVIVLQDSTGRDVCDSECPATECRTKEDAPSQPPTGFQVSGISPTDATLTWNPPALLTNNGILTYYVIAYKCSPRGMWQKCTTKQIDIPIKSRETVTHTIKGLTPFTLYSFQVAAETTAGRGPFSAPAFNTTKEDVPTGTPENLSVAEVTERSANLTWDPPPPQSQNGIISGYIVFYAATDMPSDSGLMARKFPFLTIDTELQDSTVFENYSGTGTPDYKVSEVVGTEAKINNLRPFTSYSVSVAAKTVAGIGPSSTTLRVQTLKSVVCLTMDVNFSADVIPGNDSYICFNIIFTWTPLFNVDGKSELLLRDNVSALTWNCNISYLTTAAHDAHQGFMKVDGNSTIARFLPPATMYSGLLSGTDYLFWLSVGIQLSNGTFVHFKSTKTELEIPLCEGGNTIWRVVAITVASITAASLVLVACSIVACCLRKYRKRRSAISPPSILTDNYQYEEVQDSLHILMPELRRSDGRSASSSDAGTEDSRSPSPTSTSQDSSSSSVGLNAEETSPLLESIAKDRFQQALTPVASRNANVDILCIPAETQTLGQLPLDPRQDPDGCSLSSSSSESNLLQNSP